MFECYGVNKNICKNSPIAEIFYINFLSTPFDIYGLKFLKQKDSSYSITMRHARRCQVMYQNIRHWTWRLDDQPFNMSQ